MTGSSLERLQQQGRVEQVPADKAAARAKLGECDRHLQSAAAIAATDPAGAYSLLYDAARKALDAHMLANGYRVVVARSGAHATTAEYGEAVFGRGGSAAHVEHFDRMRRSRNRLEYGRWKVGRSTLERDLDHSRRIVRAVRTSLR